MKKNIQNIAINKIIVSTMNSRKTFDEKSLKELAESIKEVGIIQPITTRLVDGMHEIVCGERRYRASIIAKLKQVPCIVEQLTDEEVISYVMIENLQREDINPVEEAFYFAQLIEQGKSVQEIAKRIGKSHVFVHGRLVLNELVEGFKSLLKENKIDIRTSMLIASYRPEIQARMLKDEFKDDNYDTLLDANFAKVKKTLENRYNYSLKDTPFDNGACIGCKFNSRCATLFEDEVSSESQCSNSDCYDEKLMNHRKENLFSLLAKVGTNEVYSNYLANEWKGILEENSIEFIAQSPYCYAPSEPYKQNIDKIEDEEEKGKVISKYNSQLKKYKEKLKEIESSLANGEIKECVMIYSDMPCIAYNQNINKVEKTLEGNKKTQILDIKSKIERNQEIQREKTIVDIQKRILTATAEYGVHSLDELEEHLLLLFIAKELGMKKKQEFVNIDIDGYSWVGIETLDEKIKSINDEQKNWLKRAFIAEKVKECATNDKSIHGDYMLAFAERHFEHNTQTIKEDFRLIYDKRNSRLEERIREVELEIK